MLLDETTAGEAEARAAMAPAVPQPDPALTGPADTRVRATARDDSPNFFGLGPQDYTRTMMSAFQDPEMLIKMGEIALKYQQPQWLDYLKRGHEVQKENAGTAVMKLIGGDKDGALQAFNASGQHKATGIGDNGDGTYTINMTGPDGQPIARRMDPKKEMLSFLTPPQFIAHQDREGKLNVQQAGLESRERGLNAQMEARERMLTERLRSAELNAAEREATRRELNAIKDQAAANIYDLRTRGLEVTSQNNELRGKLLEAQTALANARTGKVDAETAAGPKRNWGQINNEISREADKTDYSQVPDGMGLGKTRTDAGKAAQIRSIAQRLARQNPDFADSPADAVFAAAQKMKEIDAMVTSQVETEATQVKAGEPGLFDKSNKKDYYGKDGAKNIEEWKAKRTEYLRKQALGGMGLGTNDAAKVTNGRTASGPISTAKAPYPEGTQLKGPDGKTYVVKGGVPVPQ